MNYLFMLEGEFPDEMVETAYERIEGMLEEAERLYRQHPRECGMKLRETAETICNFYNEYYKIGFPENSDMELYLCYTGEEKHNVMVSRFLSSVRKEQRDRLNRLRILGDDCISGKEGNDRGMRYEDRMTQNAEKMLDTMMEIVKEMCRSINGRTDVEDYWVYEEKLTGDMETEEVSSQEKEPEKKKSIWARMFSRKK